MVRRRATAVPGNYAPLDKKDDMPYPHHATNRTKKGVPQAGSQVHSKGGTRPPTGPTGRLVTETGSVISHWCPDAVKSNIVEWTCDGCGRKFYWSIVKQQWLPAVKDETGAA